MCELKYILSALVIFFSFSISAQQDSTFEYKKRVLETAEIDILSSYYTQTGDNAAVSGGIGTEKLNDLTGAVIVSIPLNDDDVLTIDAGISAYTSASSSNVNPFDKNNGVADPFQASSGASSSDTWFNFTGTYGHSSDDRNKNWSAKLSISSEYDYFSAGVGGTFSKLYNEKNTELSINSSVYIDRWNAIYPYELRPFKESGNGIYNSLFSNSVITGNANYNPKFNEFDSEGRNSYSLGFGFSQILHKNVQASLAVDLAQQQGLLSTPFQRVYFSDVPDSYIGNFQLADDVEQLPNSRFKLAIGGRLNWYLNEIFVLRTFYRYFFDDWGIASHTANFELPIKLSSKFTVYPSYRFYNQTAANYFAAYDMHLSTDEFYTSDYDLSKYSANQLGFGISYTDIFTKAHIWKFGLKNIDVKFYKYDRNSTFSSSIFIVACKFVMD